MTNNFDIENLTSRMQSAVAAFRKELAGLRTGRASSGLVEGVMVESYGNKMPLNQLANINVPEPKLISIQVWDKSQIAAVEKAIRDSGLGLNPVVDGQNIRIPIPDLNEERRRELVKIAKDYGETAKIAVRHVRRDGMEILKVLEKEKTLGKDDAYNKGEQLQKLTDEQISQIDSILASKETEIMQI